jgi:cytochrome c biogenesis protein CcmG/thiol:disulfide interchange protein DsbE
MSRVVRRPSIPSRAEIEAQNKRRRIAVAASVAVLALVILVAVVLASRVPKAASDAPIKAAIAVGQKAPEFAVSTTNGPFDLAAAGGKPTLLEIFASWCPHCQREVPILDKIDASYKGKIHFVAVAGSPYGQDSSTPETQADVVSFMTKYNVTYPVAFDPNLDVAGKYLQGGFPTLVLIGGDGTIESIRDGEIPPGDIKASLDASLAGKKPDARMGEKG